MKKIFLIIMIIILSNLLFGYFTIKNIKINKLEKNGKQNTIFINILKHDFAYIY